MVILHKPDNISHFPTKSQSNQHCLIYFNLSEYCNYFNPTLIKVELVVDFILINYILNYLSHLTTFLIHFIQNFINDNPFGIKVTRVTRVSKL